MLFRSDVSEILIEYGADPSTPCFNPAAPIENACRANLSEEILSQYKEIAEFYDIEYDEDKIQEHLDNSLMLVTALAPHIGYDNAAKIAKTALKNNTTLKHETLKTGLINEKDYNRIVDPKKMIYPE